QYIYAICIVTNDYGKTRELFHRGIDKAKEQGKVKSRGLKQQIKTANEVTSHWQQSVLLFILHAS
ncbi:hypothetical protein KHM83_18805, partial [Fusibacter paucivorans]